MTAITYAPDKDRWFLLSDNPVIRHPTPLPFGRCHDEDRVRKYVTETLGIPLEPLRGKPRLRVAK